ncbi:MAG: caspase family protein [Treponema sp.]|nr:caspase family protein [Treponema sp.]
MGRKALVIGINNYPNSPLHGCVNDAKEITSLLKNNEDDSKNFDVREEYDIKSKDELSAAIQELFSGDDEVALLYFSGHGTTRNDGEYLCTPDYTENFPGVKLSDISTWISKSKCKNKTVILDSCYSGGMGNNPLMAECAELAKGVTILAASRSTECSVECNGHGVFTSLLIEALKGGASDLLGNITLGSIYAYIDKALNLWEQRPVFKTNVHEFISLRKVEAPIACKDLKSLKDFFTSPKEEFQLDPSFEFTNDPDEKHTYKKPYAIKENVDKFKLLQRLERVGLVEPIGTSHMYFAAMESKACRLTALGQYYLLLAQKERI